MKIVLHTPVFELGIFAVDDAVDLEGVQAAETLGVERLAEIVEAVQLVPHVELDEVLLRAGNGQRWRVKLLGLRFRDDGISHWRENIASALSRHPALRKKIAAKTHCCTDRSTADQSHRPDTPCTPSC